MRPRVLVVPLLGLLAAGGCGSGSSSPPTGPARLLGFYHHVRFGGLLGTPTYRAAAPWGGATADGSGTLCFGVLGTDDGLALSFAAPSSLAYNGVPGVWIAQGLVGTLIADGLGNFAVSGLLTLFGGLSASGRVAILGGGTISPDSPALFVLSRR